MTDAPSGGSPRHSLGELAATRFKPGDRVLADGVPGRVLEVVRTRWGSVTCKVVRLDGDTPVGMPRFIGPNHLEPLDEP